MRKFILFLLVPLILIAGISQVRDIPVATVTIVVTNEDGAPIHNAEVTAMYFGNASFTGKTDKDGEWSFTDHISTSLFAEIDKEGYHSSEGDIWNRKKSSLLPPPNVIVTLKERINPVPMVYQKVRLEVPELDKPFGFDFAKGDLVKPYGIGNNTDVVITLRREVRSRRDYEVYIELAFPNEADGIQHFIAKDHRDRPIASMQTPPQEAPVIGYTPTLDIQFERTPNEPSKPIRNKDKHHIFRIRSISDDNGEIFRANYGWIFEDISWDVFNSDTGFIIMEYYYNPDPNSRSLEFNGVNLVE